METKNNSNPAMLIFSLALLAVIIATSLWVWFGYSWPSVDNYKSPVNLSPETVSGLDSAKTLLDGLSNNSGIPIPEPTSKEGRSDPFAAVQ